MEEAFRTLKGDLGLRPIFHQRPDRIDAHLFVAFLAYCLSITLRQQLRGVASGSMPRAVLEKLATIQMLDVRVPTLDGRELLLTRHTEPSTDLALLSHISTSPSRPNLRRRSATAPPVPPCSPDLCHPQSLNQPLTLLPDFSSGSRAGTG